MSKPAFRTGLLVHNARNLEVEVIPVPSNGEVLLRFSEKETLEAVTLADTVDGLRSLLSASLDALADSQGGVEGTEANCTRCFRKVTLRRPTPEEVETHNRMDGPCPRIKPFLPGWADHLLDSIPFYCGGDKLHAVHEDD